VESANVARDTRQDCSDVMLADLLFAHFVLLKEALSAKFVKEEE